MCGFERRRCHFSFLSRSHVKIQSIYPALHFSYSTSLLFPPSALGSGARHRTRRDASGFLPPSFPPPLTYLLAYTGAGACGAASCRTALAADTAAAAGDGLGLGHGGGSGCGGGC